METNESPKVNLANYNNSWYDPGAPKWKQIAWYLVNAIVIKSSNPISAVKVIALKLFGAKIGKRVVIKPGVSIKYPWNLIVGNDVWLGENAWVDNLAIVKIGNNVCISQGALLLCGNHNYKSPSFDLIVSPIELGNGVWIGANAVVCPGVICGENAILTVSSVANTNLAPDTIYQGNPAHSIRKRKISSP